MVAYHEGLIERLHNNFPQINLSSRNTFLWGIWAKMSSSANHVYSHIRPSVSPSHMKEK